MAYCLKLHFGPYYFNSSQLQLSSNMIAEISKDFF